jgi:hypothetical protein
MRCDRIDVEAGYGSATGAATTLRLQSRLVVFSFDQGLELLIVHNVSFCGAINKY